jgi:peptide/nickel transport system permease protein
MVTVAFIAFLLFQYVGDPVVFLLGQDATPEQIRSCAPTWGWISPFSCSSGTFSAMPCRASSA